MIDRAMMQKLGQLHHDDRLRQAAEDRLSRLAQDVSATPAPRGSRARLAWRGLLARAGLAARA